MAMSARPIRLSVTVFALLAIAVPTDAFDVTDGQRVTVFRNGEDGYPIYRIPAIVRAMDGTLLAFCEARTGGDASQIDLVLKRSTDGGRSWGALLVVAGHESFRSRIRESVREITVGNPAPVVDLLDPDHPGRIWLPFTVENNLVFVTFSDDHGASWSEPTEITRDVKRSEWGWYATGPGHAIQLEWGTHRGRLVVACDHRLGKSGEDKGPNGAHVILSDDHGQTWRVGAVDDTYDDGLNANETAVVELNDGRLYFNTRDQNGPARGTRGEAISADGGESFLPSGQSKWKWFRPSAGVLDPPVVECALLHPILPLNGHARKTFLFSGPDENGPSGGGRHDLRIRYSADEAMTWRDGPLLHIGPAAYSDLVQIKPGQPEIGALFEAGDAVAKGCNRIDFVVFQQP